ncbi:MAG TPA: helix-turn-helix transcriptional regulator [Candidatus Acidoferrum sp.]|nr:helix-turn-helix transcriptional regulator [Candidatus Acidoferrum sp.]
MSIPGRGATPHDEADPDDERRRLLTAFLRQHRYRIDPAIPILGEHPRRPEAIGKLVTPSEIADAADINRRWYELAERGEPTRASPAVVRALAHALGLGPPERAVLMHLATSPFIQSGPRNDSLEIRDAFAMMRRYLRKLNACSTTEEVLSLVAETTASLFPEVGYLTTGPRFPEGGWTHHGEAIAKASRLAAFASMHEEVVGPIFASDPFSADVITCFPDISLPGDLITHEDHDKARLMAVLGNAYAAFKQLHEPTVAAVIRSRGGFVAHLVLGDFRKSYDDEVDRAIVSSIVDFASLAISP